MSLLLLAAHRVRSVVVVDALIGVVWKEEREGFILDVGTYGD